MTDPTTAGDAYEAVLIGALRDRVFRLEDYDAEAAAQDAAKDVPRLSELAWRMKNADAHRETTQEDTP